MTTTTITNSTQTPTTRFSLTTLPPFPDTVPTAPLLKISLAKLLSRDENEIARFVRACEDIGFFYLDLSHAYAHAHSPHPRSSRAEGEDADSEIGERLLSNADALFVAGEELYDLDLQEKKKYDFMHLKSYFGYKGYGANVADKEGNLDRNEFYNVSKDDIFGLSDKWPAPECLESRRGLLKSFMSDAHDVLSFLLELLNDHLGLAPGTLQGMHRLMGNSGDQVRFIKAPPQPMDDRKLTLGEHTDFGSVTLLFNRLGGLQVLPPGKDAEWCYVRPLPNHAIVNLGDAMAKFTNGLLRSNIHRVVSPPGAQADTTRYSLVYFMRPENDKLMKRLDGSEKIPPLAQGQVEDDINAKDWIIRRALGHRHAVHGDKAYNWNSVQGTEDLSRRAR